MDREHNFENNEDIEILNIKDDESKSDTNDKEMDKPTEDSYEEDKLSLIHISEPTRH